MKKLLIAIVVLCAVSDVFATTFVVPDDAELVQKSDAIVTGVVVSSRVEEVEEGFIVTFYEIALDRVLKGSFRPRTRITIQSPGGVLGTRFMHADAAAHFRMDDQVLLFLTPYRDGWTTTDLTVGKFTFSVTSGGHGVVVRDATDIVGWDRRGNVHREKMRRDAEFLQFIEETVAGRAPMVRDYAADPADVLAPPASAPPARRQPIAELVPAPAHTYSSGIYDCEGTRYPMRWDAAMEGGVPWLKTSSQDLSGVGDGGVAIIQSGLAAWTDDCESKVNIQYGGTTASLRNGGDNINAVVFNDPGGHVPGSFGSSGVIAMTFPVGNFTHTFDATLFVTIDDADVVFNNGYVGTHASVEEAMTHELGHGIGFRHSDAHFQQSCTINQCVPSCVDNPCDSQVEDCSTTAIMKASVITTLGFVLQDWDKRAADALYPGTCVVVTPPANVTATATTVTDVFVNWDPVVTAASYNVYRSSDGLTYALAGSSLSPGFSDGGRSPNTAYLYKVRAVNGGESADSNIDLATTTLFTNDPLTIGTAIKAVHVNELRTAVDAVRVLAALGAGTYTDPSLTSGTPIKAVHVNELRSALDAARATLSLPALGYGETITGGVTKIKAIHQTELRNGVK